MATASATASNVLHSTAEKDNYLRIARLVIVGGTELMREVFDSFYPPSCLPNKLSDPAIKTKLLKTLIKPQRDKVYPSPGVYGQSKDFDITLLSRLLKTICPLPPLPTGWDDLPNSTDLSLTADIVRIKVYRNAIFHNYHNMEISDDEFSSLWKEIKMALIRIAGNINAAIQRKWEKAIDELLNDPLTPEAEKNAKDLYEWYLKDMDVKECAEQGLKNLQSELKVSSQRSEEGIARVERQMEHVQISLEGTSQRLNEGVERIERDLQHVTEITVQRIDEGNQRLGREMQNEFQQLREAINRRGSSSREPGADLHVRIEPESITGPRSQEGDQAMATASHVQPIASGDIPSRPVAVGDNSLSQPLPTEQQVMNVVTLRLLQNLDPSTSEEVNGFVRHIEDVKRALIVDVKRGSLVLTVKCNSLEILEGLWEDYSTGLLSELAQKFLVTEEILEELGLVEVKLKITISEEEYQACQKYLIQISGGFRGSTVLPRPVPHFVNRARELREIKQYLSPDPQNDCRCVLVHGAIGMGKTTTAIKAANEILDANLNTVVVYVNCRYVTSIDDLVGKICKQLYHLPFNEPISEMKRRLISEKEIYTIMLLDNFEFILHLSDSGNVEKPTERINQESEIMKFITEISTNSTKVHLLVTSSENVAFPETGQERIRLLPFNEDDSFELLTKVYGDTPVEKETAYKIANFCGGIPLVLYSLASWKDHPSDLVEMLTKANPKQKFELFARIPSATEDTKIKACLDACFNRLDPHMQVTLVSLALFRGIFTRSRAVGVFQSAELGDAILKLAQRSFLEQTQTVDPSAPCRYSLLTVTSLYCQNKALETRFSKVFCDARKLFVDYYLTFLKDTFKTFLSTEVSKAIIEFRQEEENITQLIDWFAEDGAMDVDEEQRCIDVFNDAGELLAKMMGKKKFDTVFALLKEKSEKTKDQKRLSECYTSLGINEVFSCCCSPGLCDKAAERARTYLVEADRIQSALGINDGNSRAQCLAKLGRCLVKGNEFIEGKEKIHQAINMRKAHGDEDIVMLGATYNDLAVALSLNQEHRHAIEVREQQTLPIYSERLGNHPFTATILNNLSNNYYALGEYDNAKQYSLEALKIRRELLKEHYDTAKSLFDLGMVHKKKNEFEKAKLYLGECESMQKALVDNINIMALERTRDELEDVTRLAITVRQLKW